MACPLVSWLWGCSSGRLRRQGVHDAVGPVLDYIGGGGCQIVANLWDVTDKDIDKLSIECMKDVLDSFEEGRRTSESLLKARDTCKLKYAVGAAPVVYGLPVSFTGR
jgi:separase